MDTLFHYRPGEFTQRFQFLDDEEPIHELLAAVRVDEDRGVLMHTAVIKTIFRRQYELASRFLMLMLARRGGARGAQGGIVCSLLRADINTTHKPFV